MNLFLRLANGLFAAVMFILVMNVSQSDPLATVIGGYALMFVCLAIGNALIDMLLRRIEGKQSGG